MEFFTILLLRLAQILHKLDNSRSTQNGGDMAGKGLALVLSLISQFCVRNGERSDDGQGVTHVIRNSMTLVDRCRQPQHEFDINFRLLYINIVGTMYLVF